MNEKSFTSRTAILTHFTCPYKYYLMFEAHGIGYTSNKQSLDLLIGTVVHRGIQHLLEHCRIEHPNGDFEEACIDQAVEVARELWEDSLSKKSLALKSSAEYDRLDWIIAEQECLWEGLIRAFAIRRLPFILEEYKILEVEFEEVFEEFSPSVTFLGKADALFMRKSDKALIVLSLKTTSEYADVTTRDILHDMQGISETYLAQERLTRAWQQWRYLNFQLETTITPSDLSFEDNKFLDKYTWFDENPPKIFAIQYEYLIKGRRRQDPYNSGEYKQQSFLCHPLKLDAIRKIMLGAGGSTINPAQYKWKWGAGKQAKGWDKVDIWNDIGIKNWIQMLAMGETQPEEGDPFNFVLQTPDLIVRSEEELREWYISTKFKSEQIKQFIDLINRRGDIYDPTLEVKTLEEELEIMIQQFFPKNTLSCHNYYGHDCQFVRHCHELESMEDLINADEMSPREPHHKLERETLIKKGLIDE